MQLISIINTAVGGDGPPWPELAQAEVIMATSLEMALLEGGMVSGEPSLMIRFRSEKGPPMVFECSLEHLESIAKALRAAHEGNVARSGTG